MNLKYVKSILKNFFHLITILFFILVALDATQNKKQNFSESMKVTNLTEKNEITNLN